MQIRTHEEYQEARAKLDATNETIDRAPSTRKPVFVGIVQLHAAVTRYERRHGIVTAERTN